MPIIDCNEMPTEACAVGVQVASNWSGWPRGAVQGLGWGGVLSPLGGSKEEMEAQVSL